MTYYVVDEQNQYINDFTTIEQATCFIEWWNTAGRFTEWGEPMAHLITDSDNDGQIN